MKVNELQEFQVETTGVGGKGDLNVLITDPNNQEVPVRKRDNPDGSNFSYTPKQPGELLVIK